MVRERSGSRDKEGIDSWRTWYLFALLQWDVKAISFLWLMDLAKLLRDQDVSRLKWTRFSFVVVFFH